VREIDTRMVYLKEDLKIEVKILDDWVEINFYKISIKAKRIKKFLIKPWLFSFLNSEKWCCWHFEEKRGSQDEGRFHFSRSSLEENGYKKRFFDAIKMRLKFLIYSISSIWGIPVIKILSTGFRVCIKLRRNSIVYLN